MSSLPSTPQGFRAAFSTSAQMHCPWAPQAFMSAQDERGTYGASHFQVDHWATAASLNTRPRRPATPHRNRGAHRAPHRNLSCACDAGSTAESRCLEVLTASMRPSGTRRCGAQVAPERSLLRDPNFTFRREVNHEYRTPICHRARFVTRHLAGSRPNSSSAAAIKPTFGRDSSSRRHLHPVRTGVQ
jgi:hypothetical protein